MKTCLMFLLRSPPSWWVRPFIILYIFHDELVFYVTRIEGGQLPRITSGLMHLTPWKLAFSIWYGLMKTSEKMSSFSGHFLVMIFPCNASSVKGGHGAYLCVLTDQTLTLEVMFILATPGQEWLYLRPISKPVTNWYDQDVCGPHVPGKWGRCHSYSHLVLL